MDSMDTVVIVPPGDGTFGSMGDFQIIGLPFGDSTVHSVYVSPCNHTDYYYYLISIILKLSGVNKWLFLNGKGASV